MRDYESIFPTFEWSSTLNVEEDNPYRLLIENFNGATVRSKLDFLNSLDRSELISLRSLSKEIQDYVEKHPERLI